LNSRPSTLLTWLIHSRLWISNPPLLANMEKPTAT